MTAAEVKEVQLTMLAVIAFDVVSQVCTYENVPRDVAVGRVVDMWQQRGLHHIALEHIYGAESDDWTDDEYAAELDALENDIIYRLEVVDG